MPNPNQEYFFRLFNASRGRHRHPIHVSTLLTAALAILAAALMSCGPGTNGSRPGGSNHHGSESAISTLRTTNPKAQPPRQLVLVSAARHARQRVARLESMSEGVPLRIAGHGLTLVVRPPAIVTNVNGSLLIGRRDGDRLVIRALVKTGDSHAITAPSPTEQPGEFATGPGGPTLRLEPHLESLDAVFVSIASDPVANFPWRAMARNASSLPFFPGLSMFSTAEGRPETFYFAPGTSVLDALEIHGPYDGTPRQEDLVFPGARSDGTGSIAHPSGHITWYGFAYVADNLRWRQRYYVFPMAHGGSMVFKVQARAPDAARVFAFADRLAADFRLPQTE